MKRTTFLRLLPAIPVGLMVAKALPAQHRPWTGSKGPHALVEMIEHWSGGIRPLVAHMYQVGGTGDARKYVVAAQHPGGKWYRKTIVISGLMMSLTWHNSRAELGYSIAKRARELARDWAFLEWGDDWRCHVPPTWNNDTHRP